MRILVWRAIPKDAELHSIFLLNTSCRRNRRTKFWFLMLQKHRKKKGKARKMIIIINRLQLIATLIIVFAGSLKNAKCLNMIKSVDEAIKKWNLDLNSNPGNLLRIVISSFGSSYWDLEEKRPSDFTSTLLLLKALTRSDNAVTVVTIPHQLLDVP